MIWSLGGVAPPATVFDEGCWVVADMQSIHPFLSVPAIPVDRVPQLALQEGCPAHFPERAWTPGHNQRLQSYRFTFAHYSDLRLKRSGPKDGLRLYLWTGWAGYDPTRALESISDWLVSRSGGTR